MEITSKDSCLALFSSFFLNCPTFQARAKRRFASSPHLHIILTLLPRTLHTVIARRSNKTSRFIGKRHSVPLSKRSRHMRSKFLLLTALLGALATVGCFGSSGGTGVNAAKPRLNAAGSTFVFPMMSKWSSEYDKAKSVEVNYQSIGSGGGIQQMTEKTADFGCTDGPMTDKQLSVAKEKGGEVVHIPLCMGAVVPAYNLEEIKEPIIFSGTVLADIYLGKIKKWNDKALADLNPGVKLPDKEIGVVYRSEGSGTTYVWVDYLAKVSSEWKDKVGVATSVKWPIGEGAKGNEGVAGRVKGNPGSIGYIELTYAL